MISVGGKKKDDLDQCSLPRSKDSSSVNQLIVHQRVRDLDIYKLIIITIIH